MRRALRQSVRTRYRFQCGYCGVSEINIGAEMTIDHFVPRVRGGEDTPDNLVYCCHACNEFKGDYWPELVAFRLEQQEIALLRQRNGELRQLLEEAQQITQGLERELERQSGTT
jgi:5-methylcytosine-specific restriction endonuclease McrA